MKLPNILKEAISSPFFWLGIILIFAFQVRTYHLDRPIADWHSWRQADTAAISRNFIKEGFTPLTPRFDDMSPLSEGSLPNPERYRYVEFPLYNALVYLVWLVFPMQEAMARLVSIFISLGSICLLFFTARRYLGDRVGLLSAFIYAFLPYNIFYSTVIMPEPLLVFSMLGTILFFDLWLENKKSVVKNIVLGVLAISFSSTALLVKPTAVFMGIPLAYLAYRHLGWSFFKSYKIWLFAIGTLIPFGIWRMIALEHPEGIPRYKWLLNGTNIRFKGAFFYWIFQDRMSRLLIGGSGFALLILGILARGNREGLFFLSWLLAMALYVVVFATGNVTHDYYQVPIVPILSVFIAKGIDFLFTKKGSIFERSFYIVLAVFLVGLMFGLRWREVRTLFNVNNPKIVEVGKIADEILPKNARVIAPYGGDTAFLYQTGRPGWALPFLPIGEMRKIGATHYVTVNLNSEAQDVMREFKTIVVTKEYAIVDLREKK